MTSPTSSTPNPGQTDTTASNSTTDVATSGARGAQWEDAPDAKNATVHRPGDVPGVTIESGPAAMTVGKATKKKRK